MVRRSAGTTRCRWGSRWCRRSAHARDAIRVEEPSEAVQTECLRGGQNWRATRLSGVGAPGVKAGCISFRLERCGASASSTLRDQLAKNKFRIAQGGGGRTLVGFLRLCLLSNDRRRVAHVVLPFSTQAFATFSQEEDALTRNRGRLTEILRRPNPRPT